MKVAMIGQKGIPSRAGEIELHVEELSKMLTDLGCQVEAYCRKGCCDGEAEDNKSGGILIKYTPYIRAKHLDSITHAFTATVRALFSNCDIFHYHALGPSTLAFIPRLFGKKVVCTVHGLEWQRAKLSRFAARYLKFGEYAAVRFANKIINVSKNLTDYYREKYKLETAYIPNGVRRPDLINPVLIKDRYNLSQDSYILSLTGFVPGKGLHYLIKAYNRISTDKKLVIAGGSSHSAEYEKELRRITEGNPNIIFAGIVREQELAELYSNAYFYVLPSEVEGMSISLLEAMSYGNCCLVSDIPENTDVIGSFGYIFRKGDIQDLADKMNMLLMQKDKVDNVRKLAGNYILNKYDWERTAAETLQIYRELGKKNNLGRKITNHI